MTWGYCTGKGHVRVGGTCDSSGGGGWHGMSVQGCGGGTKGHGWSVPCSCAGAGAANGAGGKACAKAPFGPGFPSAGNVGKCRVPL